MNQREKYIGVLTAAGHTVPEIARQLGCSTSTVDRARALPAVQTLVERKSKTGISPRDVLEAMLYSTSDSTRLKAATELAKLPESTEPDLPPPLPEGVVRITREDHLGTTSVRVFPPPPFAEPDEKAAEFEEDEFNPTLHWVPGCVWEGSNNSSPDNCGCHACRAARA